MSKESRQVKRLLKADARDREGAAAAARVRAAKRNADIRAGRIPDPEPTLPDATRYDRH